MALAEAAAMNPNQDVGGEGHVESRAGSTVSFDDLDSADFDAESGARKKKEAKKEKDDKSESKVRENDNRDRDKAKGKDEKSKPAEKKAEKDVKEDADKKSENDKAEGSAEKKPKAKSHKFVHGDSSGDLSGEAVFSIPVDGGKEDVPFQELVNVYNGSKLYKKQLDTLNNDKRSFDKDRKGLHETVNDFVRRTKEDAGAAWDWLAELNGQDPISFKENMIRQQIKEILPLAKMPEQDLEKWIAERKLEWREKRINNREKSTQETAQNQAESAEKKKVQDQFGISDEDYEKNYEIAAKQPALKGAKPTPGQVAYVNKWNVAADAVERAVPELAKHDKYANIIHDLATTLLEAPKLTRADIEAHVKEIFGDDGKESLKRAVKTAKKNADYERDDPGSRGSKPKAKNGYESFDDLDD